MGPLDPSFQTEVEVRVESSSLLTCEKHGPRHGDGDSSWQHFTTITSPIHHDKPFGSSPLRRQSRNLDVITETSTRWNGQAIE